MLVQLETQGQPESPKFLAAWQDNTHHRNQIIRLRLHRDELRVEQLRNRDKGFRLLASTEYGDFTAAVWVEHDAGRSRFAQALNFSAQLEQFSRRLPGALAVGALQDGDVVFSRGYGERTGTREPIHAKTVFPLLDASQAVAGVLALRLEQQQVTTAGVPFNVSLNWNTRDLLPSMPARHTHRPLDLLAHTACLREPNRGHQHSKLGEGLFGTARYLWDQPLRPACVPGVLSFYTPEGFVLLGAFLEAGLGKPVGDILRQELSEPFNLPGLTAMPDAVNPLGLDLQASVDDLSRMLALIFNGELLGRARWRRLWNPANEHNDYVHGWRVQGALRAQQADTPSGSVRLLVHPTKRNALLVLSQQSAKPAELDALAMELLTQL